jgi:multiple sugar transport system permease protein
MYPPGSTTIPWYIIARAVGLYDTRIILIILYAAFQVPLGILITRTFFAGIPIQLEEAARIDGCSHWQVFTKIAVPLAIPGLISAAIIMFIFSWNHYLFALVLTTSRAKTLPVLTSEFISDQRIPWATLSSTGTITILPVLVIALLVKRYFVSGITMGAVKE